VNDKVIDVGSQVDGLLLKADRVATLLSVSRGQAYRLMQSGAIPTIRIGKSLRVPRKALETWIDERTERAA
jgi:excisionase family DNA binding protein